MKQDRRSKHIFRAMTRHREDDELRTPNTPIDPANIPQNPANKKRSFLRRNQLDPSITPNHNKKHTSGRNALSNTTNVATTTTTTTATTTNTSKSSSNFSLNTPTNNTHHTNNGGVFNSNTTSMNTTDDVILRDNLGSAGVAPYDYKTFSTNHPLRVSKIRALEQSEMTYRLFFQKFELDDDIDVDDPDNLIIQIPNLSREETKRLVHGDSSTTTAKTTSNNNKIGSLDRMKNAFKPISRNNLNLSSKLQNSKLGNVFQNSPEFLKSLSLQDLELFQVLNDEFDQEMKDLSLDIVNESKRENCLSVSNGVFTLIDAPFDQLYEPSAWRTDLGMVLSHDVRKRIKDDLLSDIQQS